MTSTLHNIRTRLPARREVLLVFGVVLFLVSGWTIRAFLYKLPAFSLYFDVGANLAVFSYMMAFALLESLLVTAALVFIGLVLPSRWLKSGFAYKGFVVILVLTIAAILFENYYRAAFLKDILAGQTYPFPPFIAGVLGSIVAAAALLWLLHWKPRLQRYAVQVLEQVSLFTYIYVPLGIIGLIVALMRNLP